MKEYRSFLYAILLTTMFILPGKIILAADFSGSWSGHLYADWSTTMNDIEITIHQSGEVIEPTSSYTVSGTTGNFSGTVSGEIFTVDFRHTYSDCTVSGNANATLRQGVLVFEAEGSDCNGKGGKVRGAVLRSGSTLASDNYWMNIDKKKYPSGIIKATFWASVEDPSGQIKSVAIITPQGAKIEGFVLDESETPKRWETYYKMPLAHLEEVWPDGIYVYDIIFNDNTHAYSFAMLYGDFPSQFPSLTSHQNGDYINPAVENTFEWDAWVNDPGPAGTIYLGIGESYFTPKDATGLVIPAGTLIADRMEDFEMNFHFDSSYRSAKNITTDYYLRTGQHVVDDSWLVKAKMMTPSGDEVGTIVAGLQGVDIKSVQLWKPDGSIAFELAQEEDGDGEWDGEFVVEDISQFETLFPDGVYTFAVSFTDNAVQNIAKTVSGAYPSVYPQITFPVSNSIIDWNMDVQLSWYEWGGFVTSSNFIIASISPQNIGGLNKLKVSSAWGTSEGIHADGALVPPGVLMPGNCYDISILFVNGFEDNTGKGLGTMKRFQTSGRSSAGFSWNLFLPTIIRSK